MQNWPRWIPTPRSWLNAIALILLVIGLRYALIAIFMIFAVITQPPAKYGYLFSLIVQLSPILIVSITHHWLHRFLDNFFPDTRVSERVTQQGLFPDLISWWEGFYGWFVSSLSDMIILCIFGFFSPETEVFNFFTLSQFQLETQQIIPMIIRVIIVAYLYNLQYLVHQHLMAAGRGATD